MVTLLAKIFIKKEYDEDRKREVYGVLCGALGIVLNLFLFLGKLFAGIVSGSIAITADAMNNLSDAGSSIISLVGFKLAAQKPDRKHPYGHGRIEYVSGLFISVIILLMAYELFTDSIDKIRHPQEVAYSNLILIILLISIIVKIYMGIYNYMTGKKIGSATIKAVATDSFSDVFATSVVLICTLIEHLTGAKIDGYAGLVVAFFIGYAGFGAMKEMLDPLLGGEPDKELLEQIARTSKEFDPLIIGTHDMMVHDYGPCRKIISLHAEVPAEEDVLKIHDVIDLLERKLDEEFHCIATIHMDPVSTRDERVTGLRTQVSDIAKSISENLRIHDFRVVFGESHTNLVFDVEVPFGFEMKEDELREQLQSDIWEKLGKEYFIVVDIDKY